MDLLFIFQCTFFSTLNCYGGVAQLARAPALQAGGQEFDSPHLHHRNLKVPQLLEFLCASLHTTSSVALLVFLLLFSFQGASLSPF